VITLLYLAQAKSFPALAQAASGQAVVYNMDTLHIGGILTRFTHGTGWVANGYQPGIPLFGAIIPDERRAIDEAPKT